MKRWMRARTDLDENLQPTVGELAHAHDDSDSARAVQRGRLGILFRRLALGDDETQTLLILQRACTASSEMGRDTRSGAIMYGKTTRSRTGKSGRTSGIS